MIINALNSSDYTGTPLIQAVSIAEQTSNMSDVVSIPSGSDILNNFIFYRTAREASGVSETGASADAGFTLNGNDITNTNNANPYCFKVSPNTYPTAYQFLKISSTDADDDVIGWVVGFNKVDDTNRFLFVEITSGMTNDTSSYGYVTLSYCEIPDTEIPSGQTMHLIQNYKVIKKEFMPYTSGGWNTSPYNLGFACKSSFNGFDLNITIYKPGQEPTDANILLNWNFDSETTLELPKVKPTAGVVVMSQINGYWKDYTILEAGEETLNVETGTIWKPIPGSTPLQFEDTGISILERIEPGKYAYDAVRDIYLRVDPYTKQVSIVPNPAL